MEKTLDKNAPTLSRTARNYVMAVCAIKRWKVLTADVKGAFMQTEGDLQDRDIHLYGQPTGDMRKRLARIMGLQQHEVLRMKKPPFGDVRSPKVWSNTVR